MKTQYIINFCLGTISLLFVGCSLDYSPISTPSELTEGKQTDSTTVVLADSSAATKQRTAIYELFRNRQEHMHLDYLLVGDAHADNAYVGTTGAEVIPYENNGIDGSNPDIERDWDRYLEDIAQANVLINGVEQLHKSGKIDDAKYRQYKAEGQIFRAIDMFRMVRLWGSLPIVTEIPKTITSENIDSVYPVYFPGRKTTVECYQQIISDLEYAVQNAPSFKASDRTVMSKTVAEAMLAKVYAEKPVQDYTKVIQYADEVRNTPGLQLEPNFETLWGWNDATKDCTKRNTSEGILEVHWTPGAGNWESWMYGRCLENWDNAFTWAKWITPSRDLIQKFESEGDTIREHQSIVYYSCGWSNYYPANHYPFMYKLRSGYNNEYIIRLADIILLEAEAYAYQGNLQQSAQLVNQIRHRVKLPDLSSDKISSQSAMIEAVLNERRLELAFEGQRWFDLVRNGKVEEYMNGLNKRDSGRLPQVKLFDKNSYLLPLPQTALDQNQNLIQNPGY
nr:RagB/SusD family nutrient uptake outer membrane protein [uncultured Prevotella sp.]